MKRFNKNKIDKKEIEKVIILIKIWQRNKLFIKLWYFKTRDALMKFILFKSKIGIWKLEEDQKFLIF